MACAAVKLFAHLHFYQRAFFFNHPDQFETFGEILEPFRLNRPWTANLVKPQAQIIGAFLVNGGKSWFTGLLPEYWLFALGALFIFATIFLPKGVAGLFSQFKIKKPANEDPLPAAAEPVAAE